MRTGRHWKAYNLIKIFKWHLASYHLPRGEPYADRMGEKSGEKSCLWFEAIRLLHIGSGIFPDVIWVSLVRLRLLVGFKILRLYLPNYQSGFSVVTNLKISTTYHNKHLFLTPSWISQLQLCWFDRAQLEFPLGSRLGSYLLRVPSHSTNRLKGQPYSTACCLWGEGQTGRVRQTSAQNWHTDTSSHRSLVKAINSLGQVQGPWCGDVDVLYLLRGMGKSYENVQRLFSYYRDSSKSWKQ